MLDNNRSDIKEIERRISMLQDPDHEYRTPNKLNGSSLFRKSELTPLGNENEDEEEFSLNPDMKEAVFGGRNKSTDSEGSQSRQKKRNSESSGKVTIPIDWDYIIEKHIKNTNTNVTEANKQSNSNDLEDDDEDDLF